MTDERPDPLKTAATIRAHDEAMTAGEWTHQPNEYNRDNHHYGSVVSDDDRYRWFIATMEDCAEVRENAEGVAYLRNNASSIADMLTDYAATQERLAVVERTLEAITGLSSDVDGAVARRSLDVAKQIARTTLEDGRDGL